MAGEILAGLNQKGTRFADTRSDRWNCPEIRWRFQQIRNRESCQASHLTQNVRAEHFWLVGALLVPALNQLARWLPGGSGTATKWSKGAPCLIRRLKFTSDRTVEEC